MQFECVFCCFLFLYSVILMIIISVFSWLVLVSNSQTSSMSYKLVDTLSRCDTEITHQYCPLSTFHVLHSRSGLASLSGPQKDLIITGCQLKKFTLSYSSNLFYYAVACGM